MVICDVMTSLLYMNLFFFDKLDPSRYFIEEKYIF
jgi:hypothetical protein